MASPEVTRVTAALGKFTEDAIRRISLETTRELIRTTPVDTGWARANWIPSLGESKVTQGAAKPSPSQVTAAQSAQQSGQAALFSYRLVLGAVFITNNVPYIVTLNSGSSKQAPTGFVQSAIQKGVSAGAKGLAR